MTLELKMMNWLSANHGPDEVCQTSGLLRITLDNLVATYIDDDWSQSVRDEVFLSAYPLALWFASSWWRLRWEPKPETPNTSWRMAHEMTAAGYGFLWPRLVFASDGERVDVICHHTKKTPIEPIRYLEDFQRSITASEFEQAVDSFVNLVLMRIDAVALKNTELQRIWNEVWEERQNAEASIYRRLEAGLGYDPDEAPAQIMERLRDLSNDVGKDAIAEVAPACSGDDPETSLGHVIELAQLEGIEGKVQPLNDLPRILHNSAFRRSTPWEQGRQLAQFARSDWEIHTGQVQDGTLSQILNIDVRVFQPDPARSQQPLGLAVRDGNTDHLKFHFRRSNHHGRRFEVARFLADYLIAPTTDRWLPTTATGTARQKVQRAFAAEFLCPISELKTYLDGDFSEEAIDDASDYFDVSPLTVSSHLVNNQALDPKQRAEILSRFAI